MTTGISSNSALYQKLQSIASAQNCELRDCLEKALSEYIDNYEDSCNSKAESLASDERAYFLSVAE